MKTHMLDYKVYTRNASLFAESGRVLGGDRGAGDQPRREDLLAGRGRARGGHTGVWLPGQAV